MAALDVAYLEALVGPLSRAFLEGERDGWGPDATLEELHHRFEEQLSWMREDGVADGTNIFQCRACGRVYVASCHP